VKGEIEARTESERLAALPQTVDRLAGFRRMRLMLWESALFATFYAFARSTESTCHVICDARCICHRLFPNLCDRLLVTKNLWLPGELICVRYCLSRGPQGYSKLLGIL